jgi:hypothetical protein
MSVHQESLGISKAVERVEEAPELEYKAVSNDSLSMFLAAIGGALLGMLLTLLILALINGGTLSFTGGQRLSVLEAKLNRVDENVGSVSTNVGIVGEQVNAIQGSLATLESNLTSQLSVQDGKLVGIDSAIATLDQTREQFNTFVGALSVALKDIQPASESAPAQAVQAAVEPAAAEAAPAEAVAVELTKIMVEPSADLAADAVAVRLFVDGNANGKLDDGEQSLSGLKVALLDGEGKTLESLTSTDSGVDFAKLAAGSYTISLEDAGDYTLLSESKVDVEVSTEGEGQVVYIPLGE